MSLLLLIQQAVPPDIACIDRPITDCIQDHVVGVTNQWFANGMQLAEVLFFSLLTLEIVVSGYNALRKAGEPGEIIKLALVKVLAMGFCWLLLKFSSEWLGESLLDFPVAMATEGAATVTGFSGELTPALILRLAFELFGVAWTHLPLHEGGWVTQTLSFLGYLPHMLVLLLCTLCATGSVIFLAVELLKTTVEVYIGVGAGIVLFGFLSFRGTAPLGEGILRYLITSTIKLFFLCILVMFCWQMTHAIMNAMQAGAGLFTQPVNDAISRGAAMSSASLAMLALSMLLAGLTALPGKIAQTITQGLTINVKGFLQSL